MRLTWNPLHTLLFSRVNVKEQLLFIGLFYLKEGGNKWKKNRKQNILTSAFPVGPTLSTALTDNHFCHLEFWL